MNNKPKSITIRNLILYNTPDAIKIVKELQESKIRLLGIDCFMLHEDQKLQPFLENSVDFSSTRYESESDDIYEDAIEFLSKYLDTDFVFEIVSDKD